MSPDAGQSPSLRRLRDSAVADDSARSRRTYSLIRYRAPGEGVLGERRRDQTFEVQGDHIYVLEVTGAEFLGLSTMTGAKGNSFVPVFEGDTFSREFERFTVRQFGAKRITDLTPLTTVPAEALFLVSWGPMLARPRKGLGFHAGFVAAKITATTVGADLIGLFNAAHGGVPGVNAATLRFGGTMIIRNLSLAASAFFYYGSVGGYNVGGGAYPSSDQSWELLPGETWEVPFESRVANLRHPNGIGFDSTLIAACEAGTVDLRVIVSRGGFDLSDFEAVDGAFGSPAGLDP